MDLFENRGLTLCIDGIIIHLFVLDFIQYDMNLKKYEVYWMKGANSCFCKCKTKVAVLCGGDSPERQVSIKSGGRVAEALRRRGYSVATVDPSKEYKDKEMRFTRRAPRLCHCEIRAKLSAERNVKCGKLPRFTASSLCFCEKADVVFLALHGGAGEDGRIAAVLECMGIPHTGSDHRGLCLSMDKVISKRLMKEAGILTPEYIALSSVCGEKNGDNAVNYGDLPHQPPFPCVIKPICGGSSIGIRMVNDQAELDKILTETCRHKEELMLERRIIGREFTVGILMGEALAVTEIIPKCGFYDYKNKYTKGATEEITPAKVDAELENALKSAALATHKALQLGTYSRVDMMVEDETGRVFVLEANAFPGMTETSLLPQGAAAIGIDFFSLCEKMLYSTFKR